MTDKLKIYAALTGDIIKSTSMSANGLADVAAAIISASRSFDAKFKKTLLGKPEFFRGDSWQLLLRKPQAALRMSLLLRASLRATGSDTRISVGIGTIDQIAPKHISSSTGEAFTLSGRRLDDAKKYFELSGSLPARADEFGYWFTALLHMCSSLCKSWSKRQAEVVSKLLIRPDETLEDIASSLGVRKQSLSDILSSANWRPLMEALRVFEETDWEQLLS